MAIFYTDTGSFSEVDISGSASRVLDVRGSGSGIFTVSGSIGGLLEVGDITPSGDLFTVSSGSIDILNIKNTPSVILSGSLLVRGLVSASSYQGSGANLTGVVTQIVAGTNVTITPIGGTGAVTINASGGGGGTPGGANSQVQFNSGGTFSGSANFTFLTGSNTVNIQASGSTLFLITGSRGELFKVSDSGSISTLAAFSSGSIDILEITNTGLKVTGSLSVTENINGVFPQNIRTHRFELGVSSTTSITTGAKGRKSVSYTGTIVGWRLVADVSTTTVLDIWKSNLAIPTVANTITGTAKPSLTAAQLAGSTTLTGWTTSVADGDVFIVNVDSNNNANYFSLELEILLNNQ